MSPKPKIPVKRTKATAAKIAADSLGAEAEAAQAARATAAQATAARLAQVVNLHIAGYSLASIGAAIGASADEVDRMLSQDTARYVRNQPALRTYVRNWISEKYSVMLEADWAAASDPLHGQKLEHQDRVLRILKEMSNLHGAAAPTQTEVKVEAGSETIDAVVARLAAGQGLGLGYDMSIFDAEVVETVEEAVHAGPGAALAALEVASAAVEQVQPQDRDISTDSSTGWEDS